jgi:hypothetical protein
VDAAVLLDGWRRLDLGAALPLMVGVVAYVLHAAGIAKSGRI